jgi:hypothetical protein
MTKEQDKAFEELVQISEKMGLYDNAEFDRQRHQANIELAALLQKLCSEEPALRFGQILEAYGFVFAKRYRDESIDLPFWTNEVYSEPQVILNRVRKRIEELNK